MRVKATAATGTVRNTNPEVTTPNFDPTIEKTLEDKSLKRFQVRGRGVDLRGAEFDPSRNKAFMRASSGGPLVGIGFPDSGQGISSQQIQPHVVKGPGGGTGERDGAQTREIRTSMHLESDS